MNRNIILLFIITILIIGGCKKKNTPSPSGTNTTPSPTQGVVWKVKLTGNLSPLSLRVESLFDATNKIVFYKEDSFLCAVDINGNILWRNLLNRALSKISVKAGKLLLLHTPNWWMGYNYEYPGVVSIWDPVSGNTIWNSPDSNIYDAVISGSKLYYSTNTSINCRDISTNQILWTTSNFIYSYLSLKKGGNNIYAYYYDGSSSYEDTLVILDANTGAIQKKLPVPNSDRSGFYFKGEWVGMEISDNVLFLYTNSYEGFMAALDLNSYQWLWAKPITNISTQLETRAFSIHIDEDKIYFLNEEYAGMSIIDLRTGNVIRTFPPHPAPDIGGKAKALTADKDNVYYITREYPSLWGKDTLYIVNKNTHNYKRFAFPDSSSVPDFLHPLTAVGNGEVIVGFTGFPGTGYANYLLKIKP